MENIVSVTHAGEYLPTIPAGTNGEYVDVRGVWPVYINGFVAVRLVGKRHDITLDDARAVAEVIGI
jgi:hypothetical protein